MKERIQSEIDRIFSVLLFSLPQGILFSMILLAYGSWVRLTFRYSRIPLALSPQVKSAL
jgi:hypothetical protein